MTLPNGDLRPTRTNGRSQSDKNKHSYRITAKLALGLQLNTNLCNTGANSNCLLQLLRLLPCSQYLSSETKMHKMWRPSYRQTGRSYTAAEKVDQPTEKKTEEKTDDPSDLEDFKESMKAIKEVKTLLDEFPTLLEAARLCKVAKTRTESAHSAERTCGLSLLPPFLPFFLLFPDPGMRRNPHGCHPPSGSGDPHQGRIS
ncbi:hypothetical protein AVEN_232239-1 [Araneus ventricosus]|uniref:Uncharacterized protein n=1 Tax=Araneus ventricosus TaxID=182803 RepID=A0A4Y2J732_ARAVE|nr:hypothetical protein AVEN_232239-1 [Araneus ventricosus]